ncbi:magnesium-translocating P-type ATPase [Achromobacter ruhlandii]|uniref:magnesium-translocating P-type ATPase n=1 Tax=Achromobacter ruhlandii TaxID=72557 RepID=UPI000C257AAB|nr:magnesium-translocating P-type ATPase [Achromobacter ruhlandii]MCZ8394749.1 magnesium-translocating P-type ATPase [Achromobacter ruhlandii]PJM90427.1 magnesium-translocating P-type ATPase [Achromobacter ruhlandii]
MFKFLKTFFSSAAGLRRSGRHFRRSPMLEQGGGPALASADSSDAARRANRRMLDVSRMDFDALFSMFRSGRGGLSEAQADEARARYGANEVDHEKPLTWHAHLWQSFRNPFNLLLTGLASLSWVTDVYMAEPDDQSWKGVIIIGSMVVISTLLRFVQERRSNRAAEALKAMVQNTATVLRSDAAGVAEGDARRFFGATLHASGSRQIEVPLAELVPGDVVLLSAGDMIPADCRILGAKDLFVAQAALTGESLPVEKYAMQRVETANALELENMAFMGTNVVSGSGSALVVATGAGTYFGQLAGRVTQTSRVPTQFQQGINRVSWVLIRFMLVMAPIVLLINGFTKGDWLEALLFALAIAVGLTPEMLPMIVTATLAKGAVRMSRRKVVVKRLDAIQNLGAMNVLCTDKTGTLTQDRIVLERHTDVYGATSDDVLAYAYLNSYYQTGLKNLLDVAVLRHAEVERKLDLAARYRKIDEIPFDFSRRRMSVVVSETENGREHHELICKGALEEMLSVCTRLRVGSDVHLLTDARRADIRRVTADLNRDGLRVIAVGVRELPPTQQAYGVADEADLVLVGYIAFLDPPKESTGPALAALRDSGIEVKVLTGDVELVTQKVCREVGFEVRKVYLGADIEAMDDSRLAVAVREANVFARLTPAHKERIVRVLRAQGNTVGFMGDGINDAPALRAADVGISVDSAVDISKEAADIILLEKSLMVLEDGVIEGRKTFCNMLKYLKMTASSNFGNVFSVLVASAFLPFLPMLPIHLLLQNLMYDVSQTAIPFDNVDEELLKKPQQWDPAGLGRFMVFFGPISSIFDITTYALMWYVFQANAPEHQTLFQSGWFVEGLLSQTLIVHMIRTRKIPFLQSRAAWPLMAMTMMVVGLGLFLPFSPLAGYFQLQALPWSYFPWLAGILLSYCVLTQLLKGIWVRRYGWQ